MCSSHRPRGDRSLPRGNLETGDGPNERVARLAEGTQRRRVSDARCLIVLRSAVTAVSARAGQKSTQCFAGRSSIGSFTVGNACRHIRLDRDPVDSGAHLIGAAAAGLRSVRFNGSGSALGATCAAVLCVMRRCCV